ncbi:DUF4062 domain-containing protein [Klebsiella oxytoca]|uniref:DUF4062 domain-containing protein n=1 Tax=Klebsiella oxytoca TaxID=571 RepID=UPI00105C57EF|nr:DUF4062 domain-containing protein [Klebsiella oxytoca]HBM2986946.1 DUF4062 domain-containing protein [Klebsiella oxytoca]
MDDKKYQVFVSSTYVDLIEARKKIIETVLSLYHFPVGMEMFSADDSEQWEIIRETIDASDYYVIIIGHKYGSTSTNGISYTEMEYDYAKSLNIPVLAFIRNRDVSTKQNEREDDLSKSKELERFIEKAKANKMCDFWESIDDLATKVAIALPKVMRRTPRVGWVRGDQATPKEVSNELAELSTENRNLRERLREYESQLLAESPILKLPTFLKDISLKFSYPPHIQEYIVPFSRNEMPAELNELISDEEILSYNEKIPSEKMIDEFNKETFLYHCYEKNSIIIEPTLENIGKKSATDIYVDIYLPDFIIAVDEYEADEFLKNVPKLIIPKNPVELAKRKTLAQKTLSNLRQGLWSGTSVVGGAISDSGYQLQKLNNFMNRMPVINATDWVICKDNHIQLRAKKLIQSLSMSFDKVILVPLAPGEGNIEFKIVCEELKEPIVFNRKVTVEL